MDGLAIVLDGPNGVGKSSTMKLVAQKFRLACLDTGIMYRAVACKFARWGSGRIDEVGIGELARTADLRVTTDPNMSCVRINGRGVTEEIRRPEISAVVPVATVVPEVRQVLAERMRRIITEHNRRMIVEGRDITTVMAPDTEVRVLLTADTVARIGRRTVELGKWVDQITVTNSALRWSCGGPTISSLIEATDGMSIVGSTHLGLDEAVAEILKLVSNT